MTKSQLLSELQANKELGIAFNQSGIPLQTMDFREFLDWYSDTGNTRYDITGPIEIEDGEEYHLHELNAITRKETYRTRYPSYQTAQDAYYASLERHYNDDNGAGGIFYTNAEAIIRLEDDKDEWHSILNKDEE